MTSKSVVIITKFDNPYEFWFRRQENEQRRILLEDHWTQNMQNAELNINYKAQVGMKVLVKNDKFKRAIVQRIAGKEYTCWLIDEGIDITTERVYQINMNMASNSNFAIRGALNNIVATETKYDFISYKQQTHFTKFWVQGSIMVCQNLIAEATSVVFIKECIINGIEYGQLLLADKSGIPTSLVMELVEQQFAMIDAERFHKEINSEIEDTSVNINDDGYSMITTPAWNEPHGPSKSQINNVVNPQPSGLSDSAIKDWLVKTEASTRPCQKSSTPLDSDDSSKPSNGDAMTTSIKSPVKSNEDRLQKLLKQHQMHKCSLNVTDDSNLQTSSGTIPKRPQSVSQNASPKSAQTAQSDNIVSTSKSDFDWSILDSSIISKGSPPIKNNKPTFDTSHMVPAGYSLRDRLSSKSDNSVKTRHTTDNSHTYKRYDANTTQNNQQQRNRIKNSNYSSDSSSYDRSVNNNYQRRSADSYQFDRRPKSHQTRLSDRTETCQQKGGSSFDRPANVRRSADACYYRPQQQLPQKSEAFYDEKVKDNSSDLGENNKLGKGSDSSQMKGKESYYKSQESVKNRSCENVKYNDSDLEENKHLNKEINSSNVNDVSGQGQEVKIAEDPAYDSWDENVVEIGIGEERLLEKRHSSKSSASSSTHQLIQNRSTSNQQSFTASHKSTTSLTSPLTQNTCKDTVANTSPPPPHSIITNNNVNAIYKTEVAKCINRYTCNCSKCKEWNDCEDVLGPEMGLTFTEDPPTRAKGVGGEGKKGVQSQGRVVAAIEVKPEPLFWVDGDDKKSVVVETIVSSQEPSHVEGFLMKRHKVPPVLVHCTVLPTPAPTLTAVPGFMPTVMEALRLHGYHDAKPLQVYGWPASTGGDHVLLVGGPVTGKTLTHVPTVASAVLGGMVRDSGREKWGREREPTVIILCTGSKKSDEVYGLYCKLVGKCDNDRRLQIALAIPPLDKQYLDQFKHKIDILVTTPIILCKLLSTLVVNFKSLNILILEDLDILLTRFQKEMASIEHFVNAMLDKRTFGESIQLIMTSEHWTTPINKFLNRLNSVPFICISDPMETVLYGKVKAHLHMIENVAKSFHLKELLEDNYYLYKTVVVCNTVAEIKDLEEIFRVHAVSFTTATMEMEGQEIANVEVEWHNTVPGNHKVLLCDDSSLMNYFSIRNAMTLVHYSLPLISWKMFTQRFQCLFDSYSSPLVPKTNKASCQIHIYIDDNCQKQLSRLINCFKEMGAVMPQAFIDMAERAHVQNELLKLTTAAPICAHLKLTGQCRTPTIPCHHRHIVDYRVDRSKQKYGHLPRQGSVKFRLLNVADATTYYVRLLKNGDDGGWGSSGRDGSSWAEVDREYGELVVEMQMALRIGENRERPKFGAKVGKCYILEESDKSLRRCRVSKIIDTDRITHHPSVVEAFMLDDGVVYPKVVADRLFIIPHSVKKIPYLAVEVRLANIVPPGRDNAFSLKILSDVKHLLEKHSSNSPTATATSTPHYYTGVVHLQLGNCLWLDDVRLMRYLRKSDIHLTSLILKNEMVGNFWGDVDETPMKRLRELCVERKISVPEMSVLKTIQKQQIIEQVTPQWAFLEMNTWNKVTFSAGEKPDCIYVNLDKFKKQLSDLHAFILQQVKRPFYPTPGVILPGRYYLVPDTDQENTDMCRALVTHVTEEKNTDGASIKLASCFLVDYGNTELYKAEKLLYIRDDMISLLPFQAIECSFHGFKYPNSSGIDTKLVNVVDEYILENDTGCFRNWYVRATEKHTVYNACNYSKDKNEKQNVKGQVRSTNTPSRHTYSIHTYLESESEVFSLNYVLGQDDGIGLQCLKEMDDLTATDEVEEELVDMILRNRRARDSDDGEGELDGEAAGQVRQEPEHLDKELVQHLNPPAQEINDEVLQDSISHAYVDDFNVDDDIQIINKEEFIKQIKQNAKPKESKPTKVPAIAQANNNNNIPTPSTSANGSTPMVALPVKIGDGVLTPELVWHQTDSSIVIDVNIPAVHQFKVILVQGTRMMFTATTINNKRYSLNLKFYDKVEGQKHKLLGLCVHIKLEKLVHAEWPRLLLAKQKQAHIKYNVFKIKPETDDDDDDVPRKNRKKFLDLGPEFDDIEEPEQFWYNEDSDYNNSESDYAADEFAD